MDTLSGKVTLPLSFCFPFGGGGEGRVVNWLRKEFDLLGTGAFLLEYM